MLVREDWQAEDERRLQMQPSFPTTRARGAAIETDWGEKWRAGPVCPECSGKGPSP